MSDDSTHEPLSEPAGSLEPPRRRPPTAVGTAQRPPRPPKRLHPWRLSGRVVTPVRLPFRIAAGVLAPLFLAVAVLTGLESMRVWPPVVELAFLCPTSLCFGALFAFVAWTGRGPGFLARM